MIAALLIWAVTAAAPPADPAPDGVETPFRPRAERFADASACHAWLTATVGGTIDSVAVRGPYPIAPDDVRAHRVRLASRGHEITEWRCLGLTLFERSWTHALEEGTEPFTIEDLNAMKF